ncbi:F-type H+-transporting ATPase subunit delta [Elusimicrobium simillimum]|uniref:ATP synthase F1 subunit delta n=1 Tax=Elusimicrobium simillimum TaxID=3143438 RepID=UPI003C6F5854
MKNTDRVLAKRYATAVTALVPAGDYPALLDELRSVGAALQNAPVFFNPAVSKSKLIAAAQDIFKGNKEIVRNLITLLIKNKKLPLLDAIIENVQDIMDKETSTVRATVSCAHIPAEAEKKNIETTLKKFFKVKNIIASFVQDASLIGGVKIAAAGVVIDGSIKHNLEKLQQLLEV